MSRRKEELIFDETGAVDVEAIREVRDWRGERTAYTAPETDQKWRARNVISFHFRHFAWKAPSLYRDVLLCVIDHANPKSGRCDVGQRRIAVECHVRRQAVNEALIWWSENTHFLEIENRPGGTNAYHVLWTTSKGIGTKSRSESVPLCRRHVGVTMTTKKTGCPLRGGQRVSPTGRTGGCPLRGGHKP